MYTSGTVPSLNGTIVSGGIKNETVCLYDTRRSLLTARQAQVIRNIAAILEEAGTSWDYVLKTTVYLADMDDYTAMNEIYAAMLPSPKPARTAVEVGKLPGNFSIEMEAIAAIPEL